MNLRMLVIVKVVPAQDGSTIEEYLKTLKSLLPWKSTIELVEAKYED